MFLGIDIGTSGVKTVVVDAEGQLVASATAALDVSRPQPNWSEQDPQAWWSAVNAAVLDLPAEHRRAVRAIGLSGQMHGATLLNQRDDVLRPAILWNDGRSQLECQELVERCPYYVERAGNLIMPGFTAPKLEWVRKNEPDTFAAVSKVLLPKDFVRLKMTGTYASDMSDAAGTLWLGVAKRQWDDTLLEACGLQSSHMPEVFEGPEATGELLSPLATVWGMDVVPVVAGGGDNAAGALAVGVIAQGDTMMSLGTSGVVFAAGNTYQADPSTAVHAFCHALPNRWHTMSVMLSAASCLDWACRLLSVASVQALIALAEPVGVREGGELFLPYLSGERTPHNNAEARGVFFGLSHDTGSAELAQAVLEGVAFGLAEGLQSLTGAGAEIDEISVLGGGARSAYWGQILAAALNKTLLYRDGAAVGPAVGAAKLAAHAYLQTDLSEAFAPPMLLERVTPDSDGVDALSAKRQRFHSLYQSLRSEF
ncbi:MAG: xylulokinase [Parvularculaceae bacterium]|nr:xylulokinase [Parvularculaceae bacterium]